SLRQGQREFATQAQLLRELQTRVIPKRKCGRREFATRAQLLRELKTHTILKRKCGRREFTTRACPLLLRILILLVHRTKMRINKQIVWNFFLLNKTFLFQLSFRNHIYHCRDAASCSPTYGTPI